MSALFLLKSPEKVTGVLKDEIIFYTCKVEEQPNYSEGSKRFKVITTFYTKGLVSPKLTSKFMSEDDCDTLRDILVKRINSVILGKENIVDLYGESIEDIETY